MGDIDLHDGDAFAGLADLPDDHGATAVLDFPWEFDTDNGTDRFGHDSESGESDLYHTEPTERLPEVLQELHRTVEPGGWLFVFADDDKLPAFREAVEASEWTYRRTVVWDSVHIGMGYYHRVQHYPIVTATNGDTERYLTSRPTVYEAAHTGSAAEYLTEKPTDLYRQLLEAPVAADGERVLEPFAGTASAAEVAAERGLDYWGAESSPDALAIAQRRITEATKRGGQSDFQSQFG